MNVLNITIKAIFILACLILAQCNSTEPFAEIDELRFVRVGEENRAYQFYVPAGVNPKRETPLVLAYHGSGDAGPRFANVTRLNQMARDFWMDCGLSERAGE